MSKIQVNEIVNHFDNGAPDCPKGLTITGVVTATTADFSGNVSIGGTLTYEDVTNIDSVGIITAQSGIIIGTGTSIGNPTTNELGLYTNSSERIRIDSSGKVGIDTTSPSANLELGTAGGSDQTLRLNSGGNGYLELSAEGSLNKLISGNSASGSASLSFEIASGGTESEAARIDSSGRLLVGTSSNTLSNASVVVRGNPAASGVDGTIQLSRASLPNASTSGVGGIYFTDNVSNQGASIFGVADAAWTSGSSHPTRLVFSTTASGSATPTQSMIIYNDGEVQIARTTAGIWVGTTVDGAYRIGRSSFGVSSGTLYIGNATIQVSSDVRLKENIEDTSLDALDAISKIAVKDFTWNDPTDTSYNNRNARGKWTGLIAQELVEVLPFVVNAPRKEDDGSIDYDSEDRWTLDQSQLCPVLIKAIQQQQEIIAGLEARLSVLEAQ